MEFLYEHIFKYKENEKHKNNMNNLYEESDMDNMDEFDELYALLIEGEIKKISPSLFAIMNHMVRTYNWYDIHWTIMNLKNN
jgi:hypothetical protein